jgi:hypothetical protein
MVLHSRRPVRGVELAHVTGLAAVGAGVGRVEVLAIAGDEDGAGAAVEHGVERAVTAGSDRAPGR